MPPIDSASNFEVAGIEVDVAADNADAARHRGLARRRSARAGEGSVGAAPPAGRSARRPTCPNRCSNSIVSGIVIEQEQIGPKRYIARLGRAVRPRAHRPDARRLRALVRRSAPMLVIPVDDHRLDAATVFESRTEWQTRLGAVPHRRQPDRLCPRRSARASIRCCSTPAQTRRRGRGWWRMLLDQYGAADVIVPEVAAQARSIRAARRSASSPRATAPTASCSAASRCASTNSGAIPQHARRGRPADRRRSTPARSNAGLLAPIRPCVIERARDRRRDRRADRGGRRPARRRAAAAPIPVGAAAPFNDPGRDARRRLRSARPRSSVSRHPRRHLGADHQPRARRHLGDAGDLRRRRRRAARGAAGAGLDGPGDRAATIRISRSPASGSAGR